jgi:hypothetical protein
VHGATKQSARGGHAFKPPPYPRLRGIWIQLSRR